MNERTATGNIVTLDPDKPEERILERAAQLLKSGLLVAFPTETVYGLGANALSIEAVNRIYIAKGRPSNNPLIVHVADVASAKSLVSEWNSDAQTLAEAFWPGPLSFVLPKAAHVPDAVTGGGGTVALRMPANRIALRLLELTELPIAAPSANRSLGVSPTTALHVAMSLGAKVDLILDGGATTGGIESTVIDLSASHPRLLRPGLISQAQIEAVLGKRIESGFATSGLKDESPLVSPGMLARHYSPNTSIRWGDEETVRKFALQGDRVAFMVWSSNRNSEYEKAFPPGVFVYFMPYASKTYASQLYATLHTLDSGEFDRIIVEPLPEDSDWDAIRDRLNRATYAE